MSVVEWIHVDTSGNKCQYSQFQVSFNSNLRYSICVRSQICFISTSDRDNCDSYIYFSHHPQILKTCKKISNRSSIIFPTFMTSTYQYQEQTRQAQQKTIIYHSYVWVGGGGTIPFAAYHCVRSQAFSKINQTGITVDKTLSSFTNAASDVWTEKQF